MYLSPGGKTASQAEAGMLSVLVGIENYHEHRQEVACEAHWYAGRQGPSPLRNPLFHKVLPWVGGEASRRGCLQGEGDGGARGGGSPPLSTLWEGGDPYPRGVWWWGDGKACRVRNTELKESFCE